MKCPGCLQITTVYSHAQTMMLCDYYGENNRESDNSVCVAVDAAWWFSPPDLVTYVFVAI